jgi:putative two-component system response regulator
LHDIGKIFIKEAMLKKNGELTGEERAEMMRHPLNGAEMVRDIPYLAAAIPVIRHHHERWDGSGYPDGLQGENIPLDARIIAVVDVFDAMTTDRPYHQADSFEKAREYIVSASGTHFDPLVVNAFLKVLEAGKLAEIASRWQNHIADPR